MSRHGKFNHVNLKLLVLQVVLSKFYKLQIIDIITIAVVAVFEIHIDKNIVVNMKPSISLTMQNEKMITNCYMTSKLPTHLRGLAPTNNMFFSAILLCKLQCSIVRATINPPMNIMFVSYNAY